MQEEYLNSHTKYLANNAIQAALTEAGNENEHQHIYKFTRQQNITQMK